MMEQGAIIGGSAPDLRTGLRPLREVFARCADGMRGPSDPYMLSDFLRYLLPPL